MTHARTKEVASVIARESLPSPSGKESTAFVHQLTVSSPASVLTLARTVLVALAGGAGLFLAWTAADTLFMIFGGLLFAALLDACARGLVKLLPIDRGWSLAIVALSIATFIIGVLAWSGISIALQIDGLLRALNQQLYALERELAALGLAPMSMRAGSTSIGGLVQLLFHNPYRLFGEARSAFALSVGGIGGAAIAVLIGIFVASNPGSYRSAIIAFLPSRRRLQVGLILDETAMFLRRWLIGQLLVMLVLALLTWIMLATMEVPSALLLGIQAGLFNFIPYLGSIVGAGPILLMALPLGTTTVLISLGIYCAIHVGVGCVISPLIQKQAVDMPPAVTLATLALFGALFGAPSVVVATPLVAAIRHGVLRFREVLPDPIIDENGVAAG
jgi:predicted PurR-regulated permease PerM